MKFEVWWRVHVWEESVECNKIYRLFHLSANFSLLNFVRLRYHECHRIEFELKGSIIDISHPPQQTMKGFKKGNERQTNERHCKMSEPHHDSVDFRILQFYILPSLHPRIRPTKGLQTHSHTLTGLTSEWGNSMQYMRELDEHMRGWNKKFLSFKLGHRTFRKKKENEKKRKTSTFVQFSISLFCSLMSRLLILSVIQKISSIRNWVWRVQREKKNGKFQRPDHCTFRCLSPTDIESLRSLQRELQRKIMQIISQLHCWMFINFFFFLKS